METAFKVKKDSKLYRKSMENRQTKQKIVELLDEFKGKIGAESENFAYSYDLDTVGVQPIDREKFMKSLKKDPQERFYFFKKNSDEAKLWRQMTEGLKFHQITAFNIIFHNSIQCKWSTIFDTDENLYLLVTTDFPLKSYKEDVLEIMKLSEYYQIIEAMKEKAS